jgi:hypothetical protein
MLLEANTTKDVEINQPSGANSLPKVEVDTTIKSRQQMGADTGENVDGLHSIP